jgi:hypothetical protein
VREFFFFFWYDLGNSKVVHLIGGSYTFSTSSSATEENANIKTDDFFKVAGTKKRAKQMILTRNSWTISTVKGNIELLEWLQPDMHFFDVHFPQDWVRQNLIVVGRVCGERVSGFQFFGDVLKQSNLYSSFFFF